jgi:protein-disulfide isomerase
MDQRGQIKRSLWTRWWFIAGVFVLSLALYAAAAFYARVNFYKDALSQNDYTKLEGIFIDTRTINPNSEIDREKMETPDDPYFGTLGSKVVIVEFGDFGCPYCKQNYPTIQKLRQEFSDQILFIYRDFPLTYVHPTAQIAAEAAQCANDQRAFWEYHDLLYERQDKYTTEDELIGYAQELGLDSAKFSTCLKGHGYETEVKSDLSAGIDSGVEGTPTFFINGIKLKGVISYPTFVELINKLILL